MTTPAQKIEHLEKKVNRTEKQRKYAWGKYYEECNNGVDDNKDLLNTIDRLMESIDELGDFPINIKNELLELYEKQKIKISCPVCLEELNDFAITNCGHKYCKDCLNKLKETTKICAICRKKIWCK